MSAAVIVDAVRTPLAKGKPGGAYADVHPVDLHAEVLAALVARTGIDPSVVDDVISGAVGQVGEQSGNTARWAVLGAGFPESVPAVTVDRQCGSSQQALHFAAQGVMAGAYDVAIASGVESMSRIPIGSQFQGKDVVGVRVRARYDHASRTGGGSRVNSSTSSRRRVTGGRPAPGRTGSSTARSARSTTWRWTRRSAPTRRWRPSQV